MGGGVRWEEAFEAMVLRLTKNPHQFGWAREEATLKLGLRVAPFKTKHGNTYQAVYVVEGSQITILRIRGQGQSDLTESEVPND